MNSKCRGPSPHLEITHRSDARLDQMNHALYRAGNKRQAVCTLFSGGGREGGAYIRFVKRSLIQARKTVSLRDQFLASEKNYRARVPPSLQNEIWLGVGSEPRFRSQFTQTTRRKKYCFQAFDPVGRRHRHSCIVFLHFSVGGLRDRDPFRSHPLIRTSDNHGLGVRRE